MKYYYPDRLFRCVDCRCCVNLAIAGRNEDFMIHDTVWAQAALPGGRGRLCLNCLEARVGRELTPEDFTEAPVNWNQWRTEALMNRMGH